MPATVFGNLCLANSITLTLEDHPERATAENLERAMGIQLVRGVPLMDCVAN